MLTFNYSESKTLKNRSFFSYYSKFYENFFLNFNTYKYFFKKFIEKLKGY